MLVSTNEKQRSPALNFLLKLLSRSNACSLRRIWRNIVIKFSKNNVAIPVMAANQKISLGFGIGISFASNTTQIIGQAITTKKSAPRSWDTSLLIIGFSSFSIFFSLNGVGNHRRFRAGAFTWLGIISSKFHFQGQTPHFLPGSYSATDLLVCWRHSIVLLFVPLPHHRATEPELSLVMIWSTKAHLFRGESRYHLGCLKQCVRYCTNGKLLALSGWFPLPFSSPSGISLHIPQISPPARGAKDQHLHSCKSLNSKDSEATEYFRSRSLQYIRPKSLLRFFIHCHNGSGHDPRPKRVGVYGHVQLLIIWGFGYMRR